MADRARIDLGTLNVEQVIVHQVPKRGDESAVLRLSQSVSPMDDQGLRLLIRDRIVRSIGLARTEVRFNPDSTGPTRREICSLLSGGPELLVDTSHVLARHLHQEQPMRASAGVLLIAETSSLGRKGVSILKMEPQDGASIEWNAETCSIHRLGDLMLTKQTKLYKIGHFETNPDNQDDPIGFVADRQNNGRRVSAYFMENFLGCRYAESPREMTLKIHADTMNFINENIASPESRAHYGLALTTELKSNDGYFSPQAFARQHLQGEDRDEYERFLSERDIDVTANYRKDTTLIDHKLRLTTLGFEGGITVAGSPDAFESHVTTQELDGGAMELTVTDRLKTVKH